MDAGGRVSGDAQISIDGIPVEEDRDAFIAEAAIAARNAAANHKGPDDKMREAVRLAVRRTATEWTGKKPMVNVMVVRI